MMLVCPKGISNDMIWTITSEISATDRIWGCVEASDSITCASKGLQSFDYYGSVVDTLSTYRLQGRRCAEY